MIEPYHIRIILWIAGGVAGAFILVHGITLMIYKFVTGLVALF